MLERWAGGVCNASAFKAAEVTTPALPSSKAHS